MVQNAAVPRQAHFPPRHTAVWRVAFFVARKGTLAMTRVFQWLDEAFSLLVPLAYLVGLVGGSVAYFGGYAPSAAGAGGTALGFAVEVHSWLQQRRVRSLYASLARLPAKDQRRAAVEGQLKGQRAMLLALALFSVWNANLFLAGIWHPAATAVPVWLQFLVRGCVVPGLFLLTGFLSPLSADPVHVLTTASHQDLHALLKAHRADMKQRITPLRREDGDLTPVVVAYAADLGELDVARRLRLITQGIAEAEGARGSPRVQAVAREGDDVPSGPSRGVTGGPFTGPDPIAGPRSARSFPHPIPIRSQRTAEEVRADAEIALRKLLARDPQMSRVELMRQAKASMVHVDYWRPQVLRDMGVQTKQKTRYKRAG
jgi:hypothetical protein